MSALHKESLRGFELQTNENKSSKCCKWPERNLNPEPSDCEFLRADHSATPTHLSRKKKSRKKKSKLLHYVIDHALTWCIVGDVQMAFVSIDCCVAWYFNLRHLNDYSHNRNVRALTNISKKN